MKALRIIPLIIQQPRFSYDGNGNMTSDGSPCYYVTDWQGNNAAVVGSDGFDIQKTTYYPYGEPTVEPKGQRYLFGGKEREHAGGRNSYDFGARNLTPYGVWSSPDPMATKYHNLNPYSYCAGDPINNIDPDGRMVIADSICQYAITEGFGPEEKLMIEFDFMGRLNSSLLQLCLSDSENMSDLKNLAAFPVDIIVQSAESYPTQGIDQPLVSENEVGDKGYTLMPGIENAESPDNKVHIYSSAFLSDLRKTTNIAHELYGHAASFIQGKDPMERIRGTGVIKDSEGFHFTFEQVNTILQERIDRATAEAKINYLRNKSQK